MTRLRRLASLLLHHGYFPTRGGRADQIRRSKARTDQVRRLLVERSHLFVEQPTPPHLVALRRYDTVFLATLDFGDGIRRLVIKPIDRDDPESPSLSHLCHIHARIQSRSQLLAESLPKFWGFDPEHSLLVMEWIDGSSLLSRLRGALRHPGRDHHCAPYLRRAAEVLAAVNQLAADEAGIEYRPTTVGAIRASLDAAWREFAIGRYLPAGWRTPQKLYDSFPGSVFTREGKYVLMKDAKPRNILVSGSAAVCFIDIEYKGGNRGFDPAFFLATLDREGARHPLASSAAQIASWKRCFIEAYCEQAPPSAAEELGLFYPWVLLLVLMQHLRRWPCLRPYLVRYYTGKLRQFLANLEQFSPSDVGRLFDSSPGLRPEDLPGPSWAIPAEEGPGRGAKRVEGTTLGT